MSFGSDMFSLDTDPLITTVKDSIKSVDSDKIMKKVIEDAKDITKDASNKLAMSTREIAEDYINKAMDEINTKVAFSSDDLISLMNSIQNNPTMSLKGLVEYFNAKFECNRIVKILANVMAKGIPVTPNVLFRPHTEKAEVVNGIFKLKKQPIDMGGYFFINDLVMFKGTNGALTLYDSISVNVETKVCSFLDKTLTGTATVTYFVLEINDGAVPTK